MAGKKAAIEVMEEDTGKKKGPPGTECPVCGAPGGKIKCEKCGWGVEELGPDYSITGGDPVQTLSNARQTFRAVKDELKELKKQNEALIFNNRKFSELVESMETQLKALRAEAGKRYVYSYNAGGWGQIGDIDRAKLLMKKKAVSVDDINRQLTEIMKLIKRYKK